MTNLWALNDGKTNYDINDKIWIGEHHSLLNVISPFQKNFLFYTDHDYQGLWKYHPQIPIFNKSNIVSFGEGITPVVTEKWGNKTVHLKLEFMFPTGSYKDRGATVLLSKIKELGVNEIVEDSSGNAGCAIACYAARANIKAHIYVSEFASPAKIKQMKNYGAQVHIIKGTREDVAIAAKLAAQNLYYASHSYNPFFFEGTKTFAYEIWEQCKNLPEEIIFPVGNGTLIIGTYIGFCELKNAGLISQIPQLSVAQASNCKALTSDDILSFTPTIAEGIAVKNPIRKNQIVDIVKVTNGLFYEATEEEIKAEIHRINKLGYYIENTSAVATSVYHKSPNNHILIPLTGHGLKNS